MFGKNTKATQMLKVLHLCLTWDSFSYKEAPTNLHLKGTHTIPGSWTGPVRSSLKRVDSETEDEIDSLESKFLEADFERNKNESCSSISAFTLNSPALVDFGLKSKKIFFFLLFLQFCFSRLNFCLGFVFLPQSVFIRVVKRICSRENVKRSIVINDVLAAFDLESHWRTA